jgi:hypothetical protein
MGGKFKWTKNNVEEGIPMVTKIGGAIKILGPDALYTAGWNELLFDLDTEFSLTSKNRPLLVHTGLEWWPVEILALRAGIDQSAKATENGIGTDNNLTLGLGLKYSGFTFDYAYHQYGDLSDNATHYFSIGYVGAEKKERPAVVATKAKPKVVFKTFSDVPENYWANVPITYFATLGILGGFPDGTFKPSRKITRAELAALLIKVRGIAVPERKREIFKDVPYDYWAAGTIQAVVDSRLMAGYPDTTFRPRAGVTRAEGAAIFSKLDGLTQPKFLTESPFPDVSPAHWSAKAITAGKEAGFYNYLSGEDFEPSLQLSRAEVAEILSKTEIGKAQIKQLLP